MTDYEAPPPPNGATPAAATFWQDFHAELAEDDLEPDARERAVLREAVRALSAVDRLEDAISALDSVIVKGSRSNDRVHPAVSELDKARRTASSLLAALKPPADRSATGRANVTRRYR